MIKIRIDLGEGLSENIIVPKGEEHRASELSEQFCNKHGYDITIQEALTEQIQKNIDSVMEERRAASNGNQSKLLDLDPDSSMFKDPEALAGNNNLERQPNDAEIRHPQAEPNQSALLVPDDGLQDDQAFERPHSSVE